MHPRQFISRHRQGLLSSWTNQPGVPAASDASGDWERVLMPVEGPVLSLSQLKAGIYI